jgi:hypothetical protein
MVPEATIKHRMEGRLRLKIASRRGDAAYFESIRSHLKEKMACDRIAFNAVTGSVTIEDADLDVDKLRTVAHEKGLFSVAATVASPQPVAKRVVSPIRNANQAIKSFTDGVIDLPGIFFLTLICLGLIELARGGFKRPPWYTAFWYAFGVFSKTLLDEFDNE